jgi:small glutamine-rich tetratricopeptide repeat-containing protein alpha
MFNRHAHYSLSDFPKSVEAYKKGLHLDPTNTNLKAALANAEARLPKDAEEDEDSDPDEAPVASTSAPRGGAPAGGMPDLSSLMGMMGGMGGGGAGGMVSSRLFLALSSELTVA